jgi:hypothetical protein
MPLGIMGIACLPLEPQTVVDKAALDKSEMT